MMYDVHAYTQRQQQLSEAAALNEDAASSGLLEELDRLQI